MAQAQGMQGMAVGGMGQGMGMAMDTGFDALYIGDLQWVCRSLVLSHVHISEANLVFTTVDDG